MSHDPNALEWLVMTMMPPLMSTKEPTRKAICIVVEYTQRFGYVYRDYAEAADSCVRFNRNGIQGRYFVVHKSELPLFGL